MFDLLQAEAIVQEMQRAGFSPFVMIIRPDGSIGQAEALNQSIDAITSLNGRYQAVTDIGGEILTVFASRGMQVLKDIEVRDKEFAAFYREIEKISFGNTADEIRRNAITAAMTIRDIPRFYNGDLNRVP